MRPAYVRYHLRSILPLLLVIALMLLPRWLPTGGPDAVRIALHLLPLVPMAFIYLYYLHYLRESDELERKVEVEALALSAIATLMVGLGALLLGEEPGIAPPAEASLVAVVLMQVGSYWLARLWLRRRYG
jgi:O-antigen/teichoic acid export membrane protein